MGNWQAVNKNPYLLYLSKHFTLGSLAPETRKPQPAFMRWYQQGRTDRLWQAHGFRKHTCFFVIDGVINRSLESDWKHWDINHAIWVVPEASLLVIQSIFQLPLACISGLVSRSSSQEAMGAICLYGHISPLHFTSYSTWHQLYIAGHMPVWAFSPLPSIWEWHWLVH